MSAVTLADLRADFEAKREEYAMQTYEDAKRTLGYPEKNKAVTEETVRLIRQQTPERAIMLTEYDDADWLWRDEPKAYETAAFLYILARDYGLDAAMLYKLSDGQIDPRKGGDA